MKLYKEKNMIKGWFVGNFQPTAFKSENCEVAVKRYKKGDYDKSHMHKIATEITLIINGRVKMNSTNYEEGDIIIIEPGEYTDFLVLDDTITNVIKIPGVTGDKYDLHSTQR